MINFHNINRNYALVVVNIEVRNHHWSTVDPLNVGDSDSTVLMQFLCRIVKIKEMFYRGCF